MSSKEEFIELLSLQLVEMKDHKQECKDKNCHVSMEVLQSVVDCIIEDLQEQGREWTSSDISDWKSTMDSQGLCQNGLDIYQFILDCLYKSSSFTQKVSGVDQISGRKNQDLAESEDENDFDPESTLSQNKLQMDNFFSTQVDESDMREIQRKKEIQEKIKILEDSISAKQRELEETEDILQSKQEEQYLNSVNDGWSQFEKEKILFLKEKQEILNQLEDVFLEIDAIQELVVVRAEIKQCIEDYNYQKIIDLQNNIDEKLKNYSFMVDDLKQILKKLEKWEQKYPLCTDKSVNLFIEIEKDNQHLNSMLKQVNNVYNDQMLKELEGLHDVLSELEEVRFKNNQKQ